MPKNLTPAIDADKLTYLEIARIAMENDSLDLIAQDLDLSPEEYMRLRVSLREFMNKPEPRYDYAATICFSIQTDHEASNGAGFVPEDLSDREVQELAALIRQRCMSRLQDLPDRELIFEAVELTDPIDNEE